MGGVRNGKDAGSPEVAETRQREGSGAPDPVERHRKSAALLLAEGQAARAFGELVRASRALPMTPRLAAVLVTFSLRAGTEAAAIALLSSALSTARGDTRRAVRLQLARVLRRVDQVPRALEALQALVDEAPGDHRARRLRDALSRHLSPQAPIVQGRALEAEEPVRRAPPSPPPLPPRRETVKGPSPWAEEEHTVDALGPPDAPFAQRAVPLPAAPPAPPPLPAAPASRPTPPPAGASDTHRTVLEMPSPWASLGEEVTSEAAASGLPFALAEPPAVTPRDDLAGDSSSHRRTTLDVTPYLPEDEETASAAPDASPLLAPYAAEKPAPAVTPAPVRSAAPVPWGADDDTGPSRPRVVRQESPEQTRMEAQLIARRAWRELALFYMSRADAANDLSVRAEALTRLAELLENELKDTAEAARVYGQIFALTGDEASLTEQVRLLSERPDSGDWAVRRVLDEAVQRASTPRARAAAFLTRGERLLDTGEPARAREDFEAVVALTPQSLPALMGLVRSVAPADRPPAIERLRTALAALPRRAPGRLEGLRCLAELAGGSLADARLAHWACSEVLAEDPGNEAAQEQLISLTRQLGDQAALSRLLRDRIAREPRGPAARKARMELVATLEALGERDAGLTELRQAVRFEPGHKDAWLLLVERLISLGQKGEAAWAMEHGATATEDDAERLAMWERLARFCREVLGDATRAQVYATRADNLREAIAESAQPPLHPEPPRSATPRREPSGPRTVLAPPPTASAVSESSATVLEMPAVTVPVPAKAPPPEPPAAGPSVESTRVVGWEAPPGKMDPVRRRARPSGTTSEPPTPPPPSIEPMNPVARTAAAPPAPGAAPTPHTAPMGVSAIRAAIASPAPTEARPPAVERVRERPLDAEPYRELSAFFLSRGDMARGSLMAEVAAALSGEKDTPRPPRRSLTAEERAGLRHPGLRNTSGDFLASVGYALCRLFPSFGRAAGAPETVRPDSGPGARSALDVLQSVARLFEVEVPELVLSDEEGGPAFTLVHPGAPRVMVGRHVVRQPLPEPELRFFAGRTLSCLGPDLLALRCLKKDQMLRAVAIVASVLRGGAEFDPEARVVREALHPKARERALAILDVAQRDFDATALSDAARHSANRAGLVACGGPGPAVAALRALKVAEPELVELVRFSASERYLPLRG